MKIIYGGHWQEAPEGWVSIPEKDQDLTKRLKQNDNSVEAIFTEHVCEHLPFISAIKYFKECFRVLLKGGILRTAMPCIDQIVKFQNDELGRHYSDIQTKQYYQTEDHYLRELGLNGIATEPIAFMMDSLFKRHGHQFLWTSQLLHDVLLKIGYSEVYICHPGQTNFQNFECLERIIRGVNSEYVTEKFGITHYDPETMVVEARK